MARAATPSRPNDFPLSFPLPVHRDRSCPGHDELLFRRALGLGQLGLLCALQSIYPWWRIGQSVPRRRLVLYVGRAIVNPAFLRRASAGDDRASFSLVLLAWPLEPAPWMKRPAPKQGLVGLGQRGAASSGEAWIESIDPGRTQGRAAGRRQRQKMRLHLAWRPRVLGWAGLGSKHARFCLCLRRPDTSSSGHGNRGGTWSGDPIFDPARTRPGWDRAGARDRDDGRSIDRSIVHRPKQCIPFILTHTPLRSVHPTTHPRTELAPA